MAVRLRKDERPFMEEILSNEGDLDDVVNAAFSTAADLLLARDWLMAVVRWGSVNLLYGPYSSEADAKKVLSGLVSPGPEPMTWTLHRMYRVPEEKE